MDLKEMGVTVGKGFVCLRMGGSEPGNEPAGSIQGSEFLDQLSDYQRLKKDSAPWN